jgi:lactate 2-monooxygenase
MASTRSIEAVANADGHRWYQLYWCAALVFHIHAWCSYYERRPQKNELTLSILSRAKAVDFTTLMLTLDTFLLGWRPHDLDTAYSPFFAGVCVQVTRINVLAGNPRSYSRG